MQSNNLTRPLALKQGTSEVSILVASDVWLAAEQLREEFLISSTESAAAAVPVEGAADEEAPEMELVARFLKFATDKCEQVIYFFINFANINWNTTFLYRKQGMEG